MSNPTAAVILCGGESRRMGRSKAWLPFGDERMLERVVRLVTLAASPIVVVGAQGQELPPLAGDVKVVRDEIPGRGPLEGLAAGLNAFREDVELVYVTGTDVPFLEPRWIYHLVQLSDGYDLVIPYADAHHHPLAALYRRSSALSAINEVLRANGRRLVDLIESISTRVVDESDLRSVDPGLQTLRNINSPEDYAEALRDADLPPRQ